MCPIYVLFRQYLYPSRAVTLLIILCPPPVQWGISIELNRLLCNEGQKVKNKQQRKSWNSPFPHILRCITLIWNIQQSEPIDYVVCHGSWSVDSCRLGAMLQSCSEILINHLLLVTYGAGKIVGAVDVASDARCAGGKHSSSDSWQGQSPTLMRP